MFYYTDETQTPSFPAELVKTDFELLDQLRLTLGDEGWC